MGIGLVVEKGVGAQIRAAFHAAQSKNTPSMFLQIAEAATDAIHDAGDLLKSEGRANIAAAGFSRKWQNAWRVNYYPKGSTVSIDAAAFAFHKIPYSVVFEEGATIRAKAGLLWLPLPTVPKKGQKRATARQISQSGVKLFTVKRAGKKPLLMAKVRALGELNGTAAISLGKLKQGSRKNAKKVTKTGTLTSVPLFVGVASVRIRKRFKLSTVAESVRARLGGLYFAHVKDAA